ncbi:lactate utilization protein C [Alteromonas gracilis]
MSTREAMLARIAGALDGAERTPLPDRPAPTAATGDLTDLFVERVEDYRAVVERVGPDDLPTAIARALSGVRRIVVPADLDPTWLGETDVEVTADDGSLDAGALDRLDGVVTAAALGIAVTGTIVLDHGVGQGRRALSLVPDLHVCVVTESQLVHDVPQATAPLRSAVEAGRPMTWISGPSATSDIELERVEGVHGPRTLHVLLVADRTETP